MGGDEEGPLQDFKKGGDHKVRPNCWPVHDDELSSCADRPDHMTAAACARCGKNQLLLTGVICAHLHLLVQLIAVGYKDAVLVARSVWHL